MKQEFQKIRCSLLGVIYLAIFLIGPSFADSGVLIIAHGSQVMNSKGCASSVPGHWEKSIQSTLKEVQAELSYPVQLVFGMFATPCFEEGIEKLSKKLKSQGKTLDHLIVFPLFLSTHSGVIEGQRFIFKSSLKKWDQLKGLTQTQFSGKITYLKALDYDPHLSIVLANRFHHLVHLAKEKGYSHQEMELVLVMHGPVSEGDNQKWIEMGEKYVSDITYLFPTHASHVVSLRDDAPTAIRDKATASLRTIVETAVQNKRIALVLPLFLAEGGVEAKIVTRLNGLDYIWSGKTLFPDSKLKDVFRERLSKEAIFRSKMNF